MKAYVSDNLLFLHKHYPYIYQLIRNRERNQETYVITSTRSGIPNLTVYGENGQATTLYSKYDPRNETELWSHKVAEEIGDSKHILVYGFGFGYHLEKLLAMYPDRQFYILEPDLEIFLAAVQAVDLSFLKDKRIAILAVGNDQMTKSQFILGVTAAIKSSFCSVFLPYYLKHYSDDIKAFSQMMQSTALTDRTNLVTYRFFKREWPENIILNIRKTLFGRSISPLYKKHEGLPALIVGSGPSLDYDIENIRKVKDKVLIIAAGSSIRALLSHGIKPHMVVTVDGNDKNFEVFRDLDLRGIPLVYTSFVKNRIVEEIDADFYHCFIDADTITGYFFNLKEEKATFRTTASVTGTALQIAAFMGCKTIVLVGQDLSYPGEVVYSSSVDHFNAEEQNMLKSVINNKVENVQGGYNPISPSMKNTLENIENLIAVLGNDLDVINVSQIGARIRGTRHAKLEDLVPLWESLDLPRERFNQFLKDTCGYYSSDKVDQIFSKVKKTKAELEKLRDGPLKEIVVQLDKLSRHVKAADEKMADQSIQQINKLWLKITKNKLFDPIYTFIHQPEISVYSRYVNDIVSEKHILRKGSLVVEHLGAIITAMYRDTPRLIHLFETLINHIETDRQGVSYV